MIRILGLDPGLAETGYGVVDVSRGRYVHVCHGVISTPSCMEIGRRLEAIYDRIRELLRDYSPVEAGMESLFFAKNITSAIPVAQARGVVLVALTQGNVPCESYPPQAIKQAIVGQGRADKRQVQELVRLLLRLPEIPKPDHAADALAAAICHANTRGGLRVQQP